MSGSSSTTKILGFSPSLINLFLIWVTVGFSSSAIIGSEKQKLLPFSNLLLTQISPECIEIIDLVIAKPSPAPPTS